MTGADMTEHTFTVIVYTTISTAVDVECESIADLEEAVWEALPGSLCHQCSSSHGDIGEWEVATVMDGDEDVTAQTAFAGPTPQLDKEQT